MTSQPDPKTVAIVQARMDSKRLPGKVLLDIAGAPMLCHVVERARRARSLSGVLVATTTDPSDDPVFEECQERGYSVYRGSPGDVLDRYYQAARRAGAQNIVRLTGDCPLIDPEVIDHTVAEFHRAQVDFAANRLPEPWGRTYPIGLDTEVCSFEALAKAWQLADQPHQREHVMPYLYEDEGRFRVLLVNHDPDYGHLRWTVDTPADLRAVREIFRRFGGRNDFSWHEVLDLYQQDPELAEINARVRHKGYREAEERET